MLFDSAHYFLSLAYQCALGHGGNDSFELCTQVAEAEEKTAGGLLLTEASKEKPSIGTVSV